MRGELEAAVEKLAGARSLEATETVANAEAGKPDARPTTIECSNARLERGPPIRLEMQTYAGECESLAEHRAVIVVDNRAWDLTEPESWAPATIDPTVPMDIADEQQRFQKLFAAAEGIEEHHGGYEFTAPASAFFDHARRPREKLPYVVAIDGRGYLRQIRTTATEGSLEEIIDLGYDQIERPQNISPPDPDEVSGPVTRIEDRTELEALLSPRPGEATDESTHA